MITSKLTAKAQTTIPQTVRKALGLRPGDEIAYAIEDGRAVMTRFSPHALTGDPFLMFNEWRGGEDTRHETQSVHQVTIAASATAAAKFLASLS